MKLGEIGAEKLRLLGILKRSQQKWGIGSYCDMGSRGAKSRHFRRLLVCFQ
jgi:hypothetical protein